MVTPMIVGMDAREIGEVWNAMYRELGHRGQTGLAYHAISAIDIALWDIRGKALGEPSGGFSAALATRFLLRHLRLPSSTANNSPPSPRTGSRRAWAA